MNEEQKARRKRIEAWNSQITAGLTVATLLAGFGFTSLTLVPTNPASTTLDLFQIATFVSVNLEISGITLLAATLVLAIQYGLSGKRTRLFRFLGNLGFFFVVVGIGFFLWGLAELVTLNPANYITNHREILIVLVIPGLSILVVLVVLAILYIWDRGKLIEQFVLKDD